MLLYTKAMSMTWPPWVYFQGYGFKSVVILETGLPELLATSTKGNKNPVNV